MGTKQPSDEPLEVEELRFGTWAGPGSGPGPPAGPADGWQTPGGDEPTPFELAVAWLRAHVRPLAIGAGALAAVLLIASVIAGPDGSPDAAPETTATVPPSTTEPGPVTSRPPRTTTTTSPATANGAGTDAEVDYRMVLGAMPAGYENSGVELFPDDIAPTAWSSTLLFAPAGGSWTAGPWLMMTSAPLEQDEMFALEQGYPFTRPPTSLTIGAWPALAGRGYGGRDQIVLRNETSTVVVLHRGLDLAATTAVIAASTFDGETIDVPTTALPPGFVPVDGTDLEIWLTAWASDIRAYATFNRTDQDGFVSVLALPVDAGRSMSDNAPFFVDDLHYVTIDGEPGVAGTASITAFTEPQLVVIWRHEGRELVLITSVDLTLGGAIEMAAQVVTPGDREWSDDAWQAALADAADCCEMEPGSEMSSAIEAFGAPDGDDWQLILDSSDGAVGWNLRSEADGFGGSAPRTGMVLQVASSYGVAFSTGTYHAGAMAILDRAQSGAVLRLTTTGAAPQTIDVPLQPVDGSELLAPFIVAGAVLPWTDGGFLAQVVAPDGTVILTQSDADLP